MVQECFTSGQVARALDIPEWRLARLFETRRVAEPRRVGNMRAFSAADVDAVSERLTLDGVPHRRPVARPVDGQ